MKKIIILIFIFLNSVSAEIRAQQSITIEDDTLTNYLKEENFIGYFKRIVFLSDAAAKEKNTLYQLSLGELLKKNYTNLSPGQQKALRYSAMIIGRAIWHETGLINPAIEIYLVAHNNVQDKIYLDSLAWFIENPLSNLYTRIGDYDQAAYYGGLLEQSLKHFNQVEQLSKFYTNLGRKLKSELKTDEAIKMFTVGHRLADSINYSNGVFSNSINLAEIYNDHPEKGSPDKYLIIAKHILPKLESNSRHLEFEASFEMETARYLSSQGNHNESIPHYQAALQKLSQYYSTTNRREFAKFYNALSLAYFNSDSLEAANLAINQGLGCLIPGFSENSELPEPNQLFSENSFIDLLSLKALVYEKNFLNSGNILSLEKAIESTELALNVNDQIRDVVLADPSKLVLIQSNKKLIEKGIDDVYTLYSLDNNSLYWVKARSLFNRSKSLLYKEKTRRNNLYNFLSKEDKEKLSIWQKGILQLIDEKFNPDADKLLIDGKILELQENIDNLYATYDNLELKTIEPDNYIEYFISDSFIYVLSEVNNVKKFLKLKDLRIYQSLANRLADYIRLKGKSEDDTILKEMYSFLIKPVCESLPERIVIIPDGIIGYVPFDMLRDESSKYLLESTSISYSFEYSTLVMDADREPPIRDIFCLAPIYKVKEPKQKEISRGPVYHLPYAKMEADSIANLYEGSVVISQSDDKAEWKRMISDSRIFHYAGHAIIKKEIAYLALNDKDEESLQLTAREISLTHNSLDMVVLSACETGLGKIDQGEGIRSLGRSFMESGAQATIISLWNVNDKSTAAIMLGFYKSLRNGMKKDEALRQAKLDYIKSSKGLYTHPYYWAAFIPAGNMTDLHNNK